MKTKTIILNGENGGRGISSIYVEEGILNCRIRTYGIENLTPTCKIGIFHNNKTYTANLISRNGSYITSFTGDFNIEKDFFIALIETEQDNKVVLKGGTYAGFFSNNLNQDDEDENQLIDKFLNEDENVDSNEIENGFNKISNLDQNSDNFVNTKKDTCDRCENCVYKQAFYNSQTNQNDLKQISVEEELTTPLTNNANELLYSLEENVKQSETSTDEKVDIKSILANINEVLKNYPEDKTLNKMIENGKFVSINENENEYSIGALYDGENIKYLCYAKKCRYNEKAPDELGKHYQWIPLDKDDPLTDGYNIVFQDITDLKIIDF